MPPLLFPIAFLHFCLHLQTSKHYGHANTMMFHHLFFSDLSFDER